MKDSRIQVLIDRASGYAPRPQGRCPEHGILIIPAPSTTRRHPMFRCISKEGDTVIKDEMAKHKATGVTTRISRRLRENEQVNIKGADGVYDCRDKSVVSFLLPGTPRTQSKWEAEQRYRRDPLAPTPNTP